MMKMELISEMFDFIIHLKRLSAQEDFLVFCRVIIQDIYDTHLARHSRGETPQIQSQRRIFRAYTFLKRANALLVT